MDDKNDKQENESNTIYKDSIKVMENVNEVEREGYIKLNEKENTIDIIKDSGNSDGENYDPEENAMKEIWDKWKRV